MSLKKSLLWNVSGLMMAAALVTLTWTTNVQAQQGQQGISPQSNWADSLRMARAENESLSRILQAVESIDTARQNELIQWIITDRNIRSRVISALRKAGKTISPNSVAELTVTQKPPTAGDNDMQLLRLVIESIGVYGEPNIKRILGQDLYEKIRARDGYEYTLISTEPTQQKIQFVYMDASLFGGSIIFKSGFGFNLRVGNDYVGYPFWLPGTLGVFGMLRRGTTDFRLGLEFPLGESGINPFTITGGLKIKERKLEGVMTFATYIDQDLGLLNEQSGKLHFGADFLTAFNPGFSSFSSRATQPQFQQAFRSVPGGLQKDSLFYLQLSAHAWVTYKLTESFLRGFYVSAGAGTHRINAVTLGSKTDNPLAPKTQDVNAEATFSYFDPLIKVGYVHTGDAGDEYGLSLQYCNTLLADGFVKLFPWLQLEVKYSTIVGRDPEKWEWKDYVMVSPKIIFNF
jgi:hypothetical protein